jgi:hypothetical protein
VRTRLGRSLRRRPCLVGVCSAALFACGATTSTPGSNVEPASGSSSADSAAVAGSSSGSSGGPALQLGGSGGSVVLNIGGELDLGGAPDPEAYHGSVDLCLYDYEIPANWGAAGATEVDSASCTTGTLGRFAFNHCRYELLNTTPFNVDPFIGGHSHCCYRSSLVGCP